MTFVIITHVAHCIVQNKYFAYGPYVREMNIWIKYADKVIIVAPKIVSEKTSIDSAYEHENIEFVAVESLNLLYIKSALRTILNMPKICWSIFTAMKKADHIHLRCPGNIGLLGCMVQILFINKPKTAKYAGNWDPKVKQPWSYRLQQWILSNTFLTRNMEVLVYGEWEGSTKNIKPFFTATYADKDKLPLTRKELSGKINFVFVGTLISGKNPSYAIQLVERLSKEGHDVALSLYGEGLERHELENYIRQNKLEGIISLQGNQVAEKVKKAYEESHFVILPSKSEGWPKAIAEGMFWGCIPISSSVSCVSDMLDNGNRGILLTFDLEEDMRMILELKYSYLQYNEMVQSAVKWSRQFTLDKFENEIIKILMHEAYYKN